MLLPKRWGREVVRIFHFHWPIYYWGWVERGIFETNCLNAALVTAHILLLKSRKRCNHQYGAISWGAPVKRQYGCSWWITEPPKLSWTVPAVMTLLFHTELCIEWKYGKVLGWAVCPSSKGALLRDSKPLCPSGSHDPVPLPQSELLQREKWRKVRLRSPHP